MKKFRLHNTKHHIYIIQHSHTIPVLSHITRILNTHTTHGSSSVWFRVTVVAKVETILVNLVTFQQFIHKLKEKIGTVHFRLHKVATILLKFSPILTIYTQIERKNRYNKKNH